MGRGVPTLAGGTYLGWGVPTLARGIYIDWGYLPWPGVGPKVGTPPGVNRLKTHYLAPSIHRMRSVINFKLTRSRTAICFVLVGGNGCTAPRDSVTQWEGCSAMWLCHKLFVRYMGNCLSGGCPNCHKINYLSWSRDTEFKIGTVAIKTFLTNVTHLRVALQIKFHHICS